MASAVRASVLAVFWLGLAGPAAAAVIHVKASAPCPGSGSSLSPFCAIGSAAALAAPGDTVAVAAGVYREQVTPASSGAPGLPITYRGQAGARIYGTDDLSGSWRWTRASGTTFSTPFDPTTNPQQVFVDDVPLAPGSAGANAVPARASSTTRPRRCST